jgi:AcrR family transcriptional regulator
MAGYLKGRLRRADIIAAAMEVYREAGYHASSLREIAKRAGLTHAGLIYYFPSKEALLAAVLERRDEIDTEREHLDTTPPGLAVLRHFVRLAAHNADNPGVVDLYARLAAEAVAVDHPAHGYFRRHYRIARESAEKSFRALAASGEFRADLDPATAALTFVALWDGLQVQWLTNPAEVDMVGGIRSHLRSLLTIPLDE